METLKVTVSWIHIISAFLSMVAGALVLFKMKGTTIHKKTGTWYFYLMLVNNITALFIYNTAGKFFFPHWLAVVTLIVIIPGFAVAKTRNFKGWLQMHIICLVASYYLLIGGAINEAFLRIETLQPLMAGGSPVFNVTHLMTQIFFIGLLIYYLIKWKDLVKTTSPE